MKSLSLLPLLFLSSSVFGQQNLGRFYNDYLTVKSSSSLNVNIEGTPYANEEFIEARVFLKGASEPFSGKMRYNSLEDQMEFRNNNEEETLILINQDNIDSILLNNQIYEYRKFIDGKTVNSGYFIKIITQECSLYKQIRKKFQEEKPPKSGYTDHQPAAFIPEQDRFYVSFPQLPLIEIPKSRRKIPDLFLKHDYENKEMSKVKYREKDLISYFSGLEKTTK